MPKNTFSSVKGRRAELQCAAMLEGAGFPTCDISHRDFGLDLSLYVPVKPLTRTEVSKLENGGDYKGEISASFIHAQIKATNGQKIGKPHLDQWASAIELGTAIVLVFVNKDGYTVFPPSAIVEARDYCLINATSSVNMADVGDEALIVREQSVHRLGLFLWKVSQCPTISVDFDAIDAVSDWESFETFIWSNSDLVTDLVFSRHPAGRALNDALVTGLNELIAEIGEEIIGPLWDAFGARCSMQAENIHGLAESMTSHIESNEYQSPKYVVYQRTDDYFRPRPSMRIWREFEALQTIIRQVIA